MARNGSGTYSNPYPNFVSGTVISSSQVDANNTDIATALTQSIAVDGQSTVTADIPLTAHKLTGVSAGSAATDSLNLGQAQAEAFVWCGTAGGSANAITLAPTPAITAYAAGQRFVWMASSTVNTGATTVAVSGLSAIALQDNGAALVAGNHAASKMFMGILNTTSTMQIMQVQSSGTDPLIISSLTVNGTSNLDAVDIDGAVQIDGIVQVGVDGTGYDVKLFGDASGSYALWDQSSDDFILAGAAGLSVAGGSVLTGVTTHGGNVVSDADSTDDLGTTSVRWANLFVDAITATDQITATGFTGTLDGILGSGTPAAATVTTIDASGVATATTFEPDGDTAAGDNAAMGYTAAEGLILTGQGSTNDVTIKNDADADVITIATGGTNVAITGDITANNFAGRNKIIGGDFTTNPWQRGTSFAAIASAAYSADRWRVAFATSAVLTASKAADAPTAAQAGTFTQDCISLAVTTADTSIAATDFAVLNQHLEGLNAASFGFGQAGTRNVTLSFWVKGTKTGIHCVGFENGAGNRSYVAEYTIDSTNTWEYKTITIPVDTTGTWLYTNGIGLRLYFALAAGTNYHASADTWVAANAFATSNQVNALDSTSNIFKVALVQLEAGSAATTFDARSVGTEYDLCKRYYYQSYDLGVAAATTSTAGSIMLYVITGNTFRYDLMFNPAMRASPTMVFYNVEDGTAGEMNREGAGGTSPETISTTFASPKRAMLYNTNIGIAGNYYFHYTASAEL